MNDELTVIVEVGPGRGERGNAVYRDLVRASLIVDQAQPSYHARTHEDAGRDTRFR